MENKTFEPVRCIIVGSGYTMRNGDEKSKSKDLDIWTRIQHEFTMGINYSHRFFDPTVNLFCDWQFYKDFRGELDELPVVIGADQGKLHPPITPTNSPVKSNVYLLKRHTKYQGRNSFQEGVYSSVLSGVFALTVAINLGFREIYLLGYDFTETNGKTHFYEGELAHRGVGVRDKLKYGKKCKVFGTGIYNKPSNRYFKVFEDDAQRIKIINVTSNSKIETFEKISYKDLFHILEENKAIVLQSRARNFVEEKLMPYRTNK